MNDHTIVVIWVIKTFFFSFFFFFYSSSMYSCHLFLISSGFVRSLPFLSFIVPIFAWNWYLQVFLCLFVCFWEIASLSHSMFSYISWHCSLKKAFLSVLPILWNSAFIWVYLSLYPLPFASLLVSGITLPSCISFSLWWFWLPPPVRCYKPPSIVLQELCLPDLIPWICSSPPLYSRKGLI